MILLGQQYVEGTLSLPEVTQLTQLYTADLAAKAQRQYASCFSTLAGEALQ
ncbi:hypothetical protein [Hymenobacter volaticus]|uniref:Uncharacterized protein n=1 Tax=Hymenobacter volaticus TaxID=2932254 RepID=A0ABY4GBM7_9BACT|nr:hypothetical protein [Hymenobacter volaticus]UOQ68340.1 hypothetical protein MUN86_11085 [Hymenobacter volaticus]